MTKRELIAKVAERTGLTKRKAREVVNVVLELIAEREEEEGKAIHKPLATMRKGALKINPRPIGAPVPITRREIYENV